jgi:hypothetical protein
MAVTVEMQNTGDPTLQRELEVIVDVPSGAASQ